MNRPGWLWFALSVTVSVAVALDETEPLERDEIIETINSGQHTWKAGRNFDPSLTKKYVKHLLGLKRRPGGSVLPPLPVQDDDGLELPETFDARQQWPNCRSLQTLRDQGPCGSCWAVSSASAFSDRLCIASNGTFNEILSGQNLLSCCSECGDGCNGGEPDTSWEYFQQTGIVTGGEFKSHEGCQPYTLPACEHHVPGKRKNCADYGEKPTPKCHNTCYNKKYKAHTYENDLHTVKSTFVVRGDTKRMMTEMYKNGPLVACFSVYEDFLSYKSGVYQHTTGGFLGGHAVKLIGWGVENGISYWLVANSWNSDWGDGGYFKIKRGNDECGFEEDVSGGSPVV